MRRAGRVRRGDGERDLDRRVGREREETAAGEEVGRGGGAAKDLEEDRDRGGHEGDVVDEEVGAIEVEVQVQRVVDTANVGVTGLQERVRMGDTCKCRIRRTAAGLSRGTRFASSRGRTLVVSVVVGSTSEAPE